VEIQGFINPLIRWLWFGGAIFTVGGVLTFAPLTAPAPTRRDVPDAATERA
jgi:cytochrome c biogenesis factor